MSNSKPFYRQSKFIAIAKYIAAVGSIFGIISGIGAVVYNYNSNKRATKEFGYQILAIQKAKAEQIEQAMIDVRASLVYYRQNFCTYNKEYPADIFYNYKLQANYAIYQARKELLKANYLSQDIFDQDAYNKVKEFNNLAIGNKNICDKNLPSDNVYYQYQIKAKELMDKSITSTMKRYNL